MSQVQSNALRMDVEILRIASIVGVVWFHMGLPYSEGAYSGLVIFTIMSTYFAGNSARRSVRDALATRAQRILIPWLFWYGFYIVINSARHRPAVPWRGDMLSSLLAGPSIHLWYLPYIFLAATACDFLYRHCNPRWIAVCAALAAALSLLLAGFWRAPSQTLGYPWAQYAHAVPAVLVGLALSRWQSVSRTIAWPLLAAIGLSLFATLHLREVGLPYAIGFSCSLVLIRPMHLGRIPGIRQVSNTTFGIYLLHPLVIALCRWFGIDQQWWALPTVVGFSWALVSLAKHWVPGLANRVA